jgi:uncharacterized Zn finger protein
MCSGYKVRIDVQQEDNHIERSRVCMIKFLVQGSEEEPYEVAFDKEGDRVTATCSCPAGVKGPTGQCCKHRISILRSDTDGIVSANIEDVKIVQSWIAGSDIEIEVRKLAQGEAELELAKKKVAAAKKALAQVMSK